MSGHTEGFSPKCSTEIREENSNIEGGPISQPKGIRIEYKCVYILQEAGLHIPFWAMQHCWGCERWMAVQPMSVAPHPNHIQPIRQSKKPIDLQFPAMLRRLSCAMRSPNDSGGPTQRLCPSGVDVKGFAAAVLVYLLPWNMEHEVF